MKSPLALRQLALSLKLVQDNQEFEEVYVHDIRHDILIKVLRAFCDKQTQECITSLTDDVNFKGDWSAKVATKLGEATAFRKLSKLLGDRT